MPPRWRNPLRALTVALVCAGAAWQLSLEARLFAARASYPWDIEWLEGSWLYQAYRVMNGLSTYGPFKDGFIPSNHPPGYPFVLGMLGKVVGLDYGMARTVSLLFFLAAAGLVVWELVREAPRSPEAWALAALAVGIAVAGVPVFQGFYDLVREDVMAVFLSVLCAVLVDVEGPLSPRRSTAIALVITAIVFTRMPAVFFAVQVVLHAFRRDRRSGFLLGIGTTAVCGLALVAVQFTSKGYYWLLTVSLVAEHHVVAERVTDGLRALLQFAPFAPALPVVAMGLRIDRSLSPRARLWVGMLVASLPVSLLPYAKVGGFDNDLMPTVFMLGPATGLLLADLFLALEKRSRLAFVRPIVLASAAVFLFARTYDVTALSPTAEQRARVAVVNAKVASLDGGVVCPRHPFLPIHDGHSTLQWSDQPYYDMQWSGFTDLDLASYVERSDATWAIIAGEQAILTERSLAERYRLDSPITDAPVTSVGLRSQLKYLLRRRDDESAARVVFDFADGLRDWELTGDAFAVVPVNGAMEPVGARCGPRVLSSLHPTKGDSATGTALSPPFVVDRPHLALRLGGSKAGTRAELRVNGRVERAASAVFERSDVLLEQVWDVSAWAGATARLALIDDEVGPWGHLVVDRVILY